MTLRWYYRSAAGDSIEIVDRIQFLGENPGTTGLVVNAEEGTVGRCQVIIDDPDGTYDIGGHRIFWAEETDASGDDFGGVIGVWYSFLRDVTRGSPFNDVSRTWVVDLDDLNTVLDRRILLGSDANRPAETDVERVQWLFGTDEFGIVDDDAYLSTLNPVNMDACDYRKQKVRDVLDDCAQQSGKNWYLINQDFAGFFILWYGHGSLEEYESTATISNDPTDITAGSYPPAETTRLRIDPSRVFDKVIVDYDGGWVATERPETEVAFAIGGRDTTMSAPNVKTGGAATARGLRYLEDLSTEEYSISTAIVVDAEDVNVIVWGHRVECKWTWMPYGFDEFNWGRVVNRTVRPISAPTEGAVQGKYELALEIVFDAPTPAGPFWPPEGTPGDVVSLHVGSHAYFGEASPPDFNFAYASDQVALATLTTGKEYRLLAYVALNTENPLNGPDNMEEPHVSLYDAAGGTQTEPPGPTGGLIDAPTYDWSVGGVPTSGLDSSSNGGFLGAGGYATGTSYTSPWKLFEGPDTVAEVVLHGQPISGFYGFNWIVNVSIEERDP